MQPKTMDSMSLKIHSFLRNAGIASSHEGNLAQLVSYFEREYGLNVMGFLESEWLSEQLERDLSSGDFSEMRNLVSLDKLDEFDEDIEALRS
ncbi:hypothetical protein HQ496_05040 [bacterium]|nr:hypothetical protein [bacterium]